MRHRVKKVHLNRDYDHKHSLKRNLMNSFFKYGHIETTVAKANYVRPVIEKVAFVASTGDLAGRRRVLSITASKEITSYIYENVDAFKGRTGGYIRIVKLGPRYGDKAKMARIEWVVNVKEPKFNTAKIKSAKNKIVPPTKNVGKLEDKKETGKAVGNKKDMPMPQKIKVEKADNKVVKKQAAKIQKRTVSKPKVINRVSKPK